ncbi:MAG: DUF7064 domain-containing protein [Sporichthyaceae bacterium]
MIAPLTQFAPEDDLLHAESASGPLARESLAITAPIPEENLLVFVYVWREGGTKWGRFVFVAGPDFTKPDYLSYVADAEHSGDDLRDFAVSGLTCRQSDPLKVAEFAFDDGELDLALRFEGVHHPFTWRDNADGCPDWMAHNRYEQSGVTRGRLRLRGREVEFTGVGHRDHSWGTRNWNYMMHWKWINAVTPDGALSLHLCLMNASGKALLWGYVNRAGVVARIVGADVDFDLDAAMMHRRVAGTVRDESGAELTFEGHYAAGWGMPIQSLVLHEVGMSATLNGRPAGAHVEMGWLADYVRGIVGGP